MGLRMPVGSDCRERRYWLLGGVAGAWRLYCEEKDGELWVSWMHTAAAAARVGLQQRARCRQSAFGLQQGSSICA
jgi:hypothetical protein